MIAVQIGHHDVEQDEIELALLNDAQRLRPIGGADHFVTFATQTAREYVAVRRAIVNDKDQTAPCSFRAARIGKLLQRAGQTLDHRRDIRVRRIKRACAHFEIGEVHDVFDEREQALTSRMNLL